MGVKEHPRSLRVASGGTKLVTNQVEIGFNGGTGAVTLSGPGTSCNTSGATYAGTGAGADIGNGFVGLDHDAIWTLSTSQVHGRGPFVGGLLNLSSGASLTILSGAGVDAVAFNESADSTLTLGLDGAAPSLNGQLDVGTTTNFAGTLDITFENGFVPAPGEQFQLFTFGSEAASSRR